MTWKSLNVPRVREKLTWLLYDGVFEYFCKTDFMITPKNSRFSNIGCNGTHTPGLSDPYFHKMASSFVGGVGEIAENATYKFRKINHSWREDTVVYNRIDNWKYYLIWFCNSRNRYYVFAKLETALYRLLILKKDKKGKSNCYLGLG